MHPVATDAEILQFFCRHLMGLAWYEGPVNTESDFTANPIFYGASGFLLQAHPEINAYNLITAGHVFTDYAERMRDANITSQAHSLFDIWGPNPPSDHRITFNIFDAPSIHEYDKAAGIDFDEACRNPPAWLCQYNWDIAERFTHAALVAHGVGSERDGFRYAGGLKRKIDCNAVYRLMGHGLWWPLLEGFCETTRKRNNWHTV